jgi:hypothetical protein
MASRNTLLDIAKANGSDAITGLVDETIRFHPELMLGAARTIKGLSYKTLVRTALPAVGFRAANEGVTVDKSTYENRNVECFILTPRVECDKAIADKYEDGADAFIALESAGVMESTLQYLSTQMYYGNTGAIAALNGGPNDAKGFPGLIQSYDATNMVVDAGGTTANTGSSVWLIKFGPKDAQWVWGSNGELALSDVRTETLYDANSKPFTGYVQELGAYPGFQVGSVNSAVRIKKLTADSGKGLTDLLISSAISKFPAGWAPDVILATRRSRTQLQQARTATLFSYMGQQVKGSSSVIAPLPDDWNGIPIAVTDAIKDTESLSL